MMLDYELSGPMGALKETLDTAGNKIAFLYLYGMVDKGDMDSGSSTATSGVLNSKEN